MPQKLIDAPERLLGRNDEDTDKGLTLKGLTIPGSRAGTQTQTWLCRVLTPLPKLPNSQVLLVSVCKEKKKTSQVALIILKFIKCCANCK